eukprot:CAMPEP_0113684680 /NCGR_PEP_ID=MMETSP0038_2-20120614/14171_1 /TAXON_ID=2898 /ORGANISM="Cryptomonas paramecium" /LENGTH=291 /DNA_ID=CAMNT_0000604523 /DNA_START=225 /DNA_END=1100 /DNA_ORIENTATION=- /assembly_acc=CAM_ASM_000170
MLVEGRSTPLPSMSLNRTFRISSFRCSRSAHFQLQQRLDDRFLFSLRPQLDDLASQRRTSPFSTSVPVAVLVQLHGRPSIGRVEFRLLGFPTVDSTLDIRWGFVSSYGPRRRAMLVAEIPNLAAQHTTEHHLVAPLAYACLVDILLSKFNRASTAHGAPAAIHTPLSIERFADLLHDAAPPGMELALCHRVLHPHRHPDESFANFFERWQGDRTRAARCGLGFAAAPFFLAASSQLSPTEESAFHALPEVAAALPRPEQVSLAGELAALQAAVHTAAAIFQELGPHHKGAG